MKVGIAQIEKYKGIIVDTVDEIQKTGGRISINALAKKHRVNSDFFSALVTKGLLLRSSDIHGRLIHVWNGKPEPDNRLVEDLIDTLRIKHKLKLVKKDVRVPDLPNFTKKEQIVVTKAKKIEAVEPVVELPNEVVEVEETTIVEATPKEKKAVDEEWELIQDLYEVKRYETPFTAVEAVGVKVPRVYKKRVKTVDYLETVSYVYFLGMKILTIEKTQWTNTQKENGLSPLK